MTLKATHYLGAVLGGLVAGLFVLGVSTGGRHLDASYTPRGVRMLSLCPSAGQWLDDYEQAAEDYLEHTTCPLPVIRLDDCDGEQRADEVRLYACSDVQLGDPGCSLEQADNVGRRRAYHEARAPKYTAHHVLGHVAGLGWEQHATAASSWMAARPGSEATGIDCDDEG